MSKIRVNLPGGKKSDGTMSTPYASEVDAGRITGFTENVDDKKNVVSVSVEFDGNPLSAITVTPEDGNRLRAAKRELDGDGGKAEEAAKG